MLLTDTFTPDALHAGKYEKFQSSWRQNLGNLAIYKVWKHTAIFSPSFPSLQ